MPRTIDTCPSLQEPKAKPFVKWVGGKGQLLSQLAPFIIQEIRERSLTQYIERVWAKRAVNAQADKRGKITEVMIRNFD